MWHVDAKIDVSTPDRKMEWEATNAYTRTYPADTFGTIVFQGFGQESTRACPVISPLKIFSLLVYVLMFTLLR